MVSINFNSDRVSRCLKLKVKGHAGMAEAGKDLVCSAVSILTYTVAQSVSHMMQSQLLVEVPRISLKDGDAEISCKCFAHTFNDVESAFRFAITGYTLLMHSYPQYVKLNVNGEAIQP